MSYSEFMNDMVSLDTPTVVCTNSAQDALVAAERCFFDRGVVKDKLLKFVVTPEVNSWIEETVITKAYLAELVKNGFIEYLVVDDVAHRVVASKNRAGIIASESDHVFLHHSEPHRDSPSTVDGINSVIRETESKRDFYDYCMDVVAEAEVVNPSEYTYSRLLNCSEECFDTEFRSALSEYIDQFQWQEMSMSSKNSSFCKLVSLLVAKRQGDMALVNEFLPHVGVCSKYTVTTTVRSLEDDNIISTATKSDAPGRPKVLSVENEPDDYTSLFT